MMPRSRGGRAATPSDGEPQQPRQPPLPPQPDRDRSHQWASEPAVPWPRTGAWPALWRVSSPVAIVNAGVASDKICPLLRDAHLAAAVRRPAPDVRRLDDPLGLGA